MNDDFYRKVEIFRLMHKLRLCHFVVKDGGRHGPVGCVARWDD